MQSLNALLLLGSSRQRCRFNIHSYIGWIDKYCQFNQYNYKFWDGIAATRIKLRLFEIFHAANSPPAPFSKAKNNSLQFLFINAKFCYQRMELRKGHYIFSLLQMSNVQQCWTLLFSSPVTVLPFSFSEHCLNQLEGTISGILQPIVEAIIAAIIGNSWTTGRCHCLIFVLKYVDSYFGDYLRSLRVDGDKELNWTFKITIKTLIIAFKFLFLDPLPPSGSNQSSFLDALASLDFKLWVSQLLTFFTASASTSLSDYFTASASKGLSDYF